MILTVYVIAWQTGVLPDLRQSPVLRPLLPECFHRQYHGVDGLHSASRQIRSTGGGGGEDQRPADDENFTCVLRSMSREGTPTDNPIIEALNGWMKEELYLDFALAATDDVPLLLDTYVHYFNYRRPAAALGYKSPVQYKTELGF